MTPIKDPAESVVMEFDFSSEMAAISSASVAVSIYGSGTDPAVATVLDGALQISGTSVFQRVHNGVHGVDYALRCLATSGSDILLRADVMPVRAEPLS